MAIGWVLLNNGAFVIYSGDLPSGQKLYLENQGDRTVVTVLMQQSGQQQQSGSCFVTGSWQIPPEVFVSPQGVAIVRVMTAAGLWTWMVQGMNLMVQSGAVAVDDLRSINLSTLSQMPNSQMSNSQQQSSTGTNALFEMQPMQPLQPMTMGNMGMSTNPMQMQMGNMSLSMGQKDSTVPVNVAPAGGVPAKATQPKTAKFCSQCGSGLVDGARFCSSCGYQLT